jgi:cystathionine beta-lyase/cystathionine gamma-synthase
MTRLDELISAVEAWKGTLIEKSKVSDKNEATLIVWLETPSNPLTKVTDIQAICKAIKEFNWQDTDTRILTFVDSTWAPPKITQPLLVSLSKNA